MTSRREIRSFVERSPEVWAGRTLRDAYRDSEEIERTCWRDLFEAAPAKIAERMGLSVTERQGALILQAPGVDSLLFNRVIGLGERRAASNETVAFVRERFRERGISRYFVHLGPRAQPSDLGPRLRRDGLEPYRRAWVKLSRPRAPVAIPDTTVVVREVSADQAVTFGRILVKAFEMPLAVTWLLSAIVGRPRWRAFVGLCGDQPVGAGALFVDNGIGYLPFGGTLAPFRGRGAQAAILVRRIQEALGEGCEKVVTETGYPFPWEPNPSYRDILRLGFEPIAVRANYAEPHVRWAPASPDENRGG